VAKRLTDVVVPSPSGLDQMRFEELVEHYRALALFLWTRLAPDPLNGGGMDGQGDVWVDWEVAADVEFTNIVQTSREHPTATVKVRVVAEAR
jgi:phosphodiesterase/alkaline phosphatase D-like protein